MTAAPLITPSDLSLPPKFPHWRDGQYSSLMEMADAPTRFIASNDPTGSGKSLKAAALIRLLGVRGVILTSTKSLQLQYTSDFSSMGLTDIRGRANYSCPSYNTCAEGRLFGCKDPECNYVSDLKQFLESQFGITNYSYYLSTRIHSDGVGPIGLLVLDECHNAVQELCSALEIHLRRTSPFYTGTIPSPPFGRQLPWYREWAKSSVPLMKEAVAECKSNDKKLLSQADELHTNLTRIATLPDEWILDESYPKEVVFAPLWPTDQAQKLMFAGVDKALLMSATLVPKTLDLLNVPADDCTFLRSHYSFDTRRSPVYLFGASRIDHRTPESDFMQLLGRMDTLISYRLDRKGIIHSVSYDRAEWLKSRSEYAGIMLAPRAHELAAAMEEFRRSKPPRILVSPAITTGYDFPGTDAEYQFIVKVPFIDQRGPVMKARCEDDPEYGMYLTIQNLVQMCGRLMRGPDDSSETFILDKHINWLLLPEHKGGKYRHLFPQWFLNLIQYPKSQPRPLEKLA